MGANGVRGIAVWGWLAAVVLMFLSLGRPVQAGAETEIYVLLFSASSTPALDVVALSAPAGGNGIVDVAGGVAGAALTAPAAGGAGAFAVATVNVGPSGQVTAAPDMGNAVLPVGLSICQTDPATGGGPSDAPRCAAWPQ